MRIQLREEQVAALTALAAQRGTTVSDLVRQGVDRLLADEQPPDDTADVIALGGPSDEHDAGEDATEPPIEEHGSAADGTGEPSI